MAKTVFHGAYLKKNVNFMFLNIWLFKLNISIEFFAIYCEFGLYLYYFFHSAKYPLISVYK